MDRWRFYDITHRTHDIMNPLSSAKLDHVVDGLGLRRGARVIDIGCGKGEFLVRLAARYRAEGIGVDISPYAVRDARLRAAARTPGARLTFVEADGKAFEPPGGAAFDMASCLGATWIFGGLSGTLHALAGYTRPGGTVVVGHPFWLKTPPPEYLAAEGLREGEFGSDDENAAVGSALGLRLVTKVVSGTADFDNYEGWQWAAAAAFARENPGDGDLAEVERRVAVSKDAYLRWGRDVLGWAVYIFKNE